MFFMWVVRMCESILSRRNGSMAAAA